MQPALRSSSGPCTTARFGGQQLSAGGYAEKRIQDRKVCCLTGSLPSFNQSTSKCCARGAEALAAGQVLPCRPIAALKLAQYAAEPRILCLALQRGWPIIPLLWCSLRP